ncbi:MAG TPA: hypothetical protein VFV38_23025 [Ktedonobacteraceae bacterium]|nr:hypothetical protein [Ktedonobacteraceae bacterium]
MNIYIIYVEPLQIDTEVEEVAHSVVIALDIDQTISSGFVGKSVQESIHY